MDPKVFQAAIQLASIMNEPDAQAKRVKNLILEGNLHAAYEAAHRAMLGFKEIKSFIAAIEPEAKLK